MIAYGIILSTDVALNQLSQKALGKDSSIRGYLLTTFDPPLDEDEIKEFDKDCISFWIENFESSNISKVDPGNFTCKIFPDDKLFLGYIYSIPDKFTCTVDIKNDIRENLISWLQNKGFPNFHPYMHIKRR
jgi:hypothetical protein